MALEIRSRRDWSIITELPAIGFGLQKRPDALPGERFLSKSWNDMQVGMEEFLAANAPAVPTHVVAVG
jgi:hypothetical protein